MANIEVSVYIANLGKYNEGENIGAWLELPASEEEINQTLQKIGINSEYEEYFITDTDTNLDINISEYSNIYTLSEAIETLQCAEDNAELYNAINEYDTINIQDLEEIDDLYFDVKGGRYLFYEGLTAIEYEKQKVEEHKQKLDDLGWLRPYISINYEQMAHDDGDLTETRAGVLVVC